MRTANWRWFALIGVLVILLLIVVSCLIQPDQTANLTSPTDPMLRPFATATPTPPPGQGGQGDLQTGLPQGQGTVGPTSTVQIITAPPAAIWTYSPEPTTAATDDGMLRNGSTGAAVRSLQQRLKDLQYYKGTVDGDFGAGTESALKAFQARNGLTADGVAGPNTLAILNSSSAKKAPSPTTPPTKTPTKAPTKKPASNATAKPTSRTYTPSTLAPGTRYLQLGSTGSDVKRLQNRLSELGYYSGSAGGTFDEATEQAVIAFQKRNGQYADGVAGQDTQAALYGSGAIPALGH